MYRKTKQLREFEPILYKNGYRFARCKGSHLIYMNRTSHKIITVNKDLRVIDVKQSLAQNKIVLYCD